MTQKLKKVPKRPISPPANLGGRPTVITEAVVQKLIDIFKIGGTAIEACAYAKIGRQTYYDRLASDDGFRAEMESAQYFADLAAKKVVVDKILKDKDDQNARWWLEKRRPEQFGGGSLAGGTVDNRTQNIFISNDEQLAERLVGYISRLRQTTSAEKTSQD
jgi:hypothetical protein